jgi:hypothetical protein
MAGVADDDQLTRLVRIPLRLAMHLRHERTGRVDDAETTIYRTRLDAPCHTVCAEDHDRAVRHVGQLFDKDGAPSLEIFDHAAVMHDLVQYVYRRAMYVERPLDDLDCSDDSRAKSSGLRQH